MLVVLSCNFNRYAVCFQSFMNIACRSYLFAARIKRFSRLHIVIKPLNKKKPNKLFMLKHNPINRFTANLGSLKVGAFHYAKISGNFGPNVNGTVRSRWKFSGQSGPPPEVVLFDRFDRLDRKLPFHFRNFCFQSRSSSSLHTEVKMADVDGSVCEVYQCSVCKLQTDDINALIMHSCTLGTGTVVHLNLIFFWFS